MKLEKENDDIAFPREIYHYIFFKESKDMENFEASIANQGFKIIEKNQDNSLDNINADHPYTILISREEAPYKISDTTIFLYRMAKNFNGVYDGWETQLCASKKS